MTKLFVGTDPEFPLFDKTTKQLKSAIGVVHGNKEKKVDLGNGHKTFPDNVNVEVNITPGGSADELVEHLQQCFTALSRVVYPYQILLQASSTFPKKECEHPDAKVFGCEPEYCAYELGMVQAPDCTTTFRSAGGHIHLGYNEEVYPLLAPEDGSQDRAYGRVYVVRMMDLFVGIPSLWLDQDSTSAARRKLYGKSGTHRPKDYGVEWRPAGNFWMKTKEHVKLIYDLSEFVVNFVAERGYEKLWKADNDIDVTEACFGYDVNALRAAIDGSDKKKAETFLNGPVKKYMPAKLFNRMLALCEPDAEPIQNVFLRSWGLERTSR